MLDFTPGQTVGEYEIRGLIGKGGMAEVYHAYHPLMEREVALKVGRPERHDHDATRRRFRREVIVSGRLAHPNVLRAYHAGEMYGVLYLVTEYVDGHDLTATVRDRGPLPVEEAVQFVLQAARGLQHIHNHGFVHRDIKPSNLLVDTAGKVYVSDVGLAGYQEGLVTIDQSFLATEAADESETLARDIEGDSHAVAKRTEVPGGDEATAAKPVVLSQVAEGVSNTDLDDSPRQGQSSPPADEGTETLSTDEFEAIGSGATLPPDALDDNGGGNDATQSLPEPHADGPASAVDSTLDAIGLATADPRVSRPVTDEMEHEPEEQNEPDGTKPHETPSEYPAGWEELSDPNIAMGTPAFMPPEQCHTTKVDRRADIYALGCTFFYLVTGRYVHESFARHMSPMLYLQAALRSSPPSLLDIRDDVPEHFDTVYQKMVAKKVDERYQSVGDVIADLEAALAGHLTTPRIFISYRRTDSIDATDRLNEHLVAHFGEDFVFMDVDTIPPGEDFRSHLRDAVCKCDIFLAIIGDHWLSATNEDGSRRIDDESDFVRIEIENALALDCPVMPILVGQASMPGETDLPEPLRDLAFRHAAEVRPGRGYRRDIERLTGAIEKAHKSKLETKKGELTSARPA